MPPRTELVTVHQPKAGRTSLALLPAQRADFATCRTILQRDPDGLAIAALLLPRRLRDSAAALYGLFFSANAAIRHHPDPQKLDAFRRRIELIAAGSPENGAVDRAFAHTAAAHTVPPELLFAILEGLAWDAEDRRYRSLSDLVAYAARASGTASMMLALFMGVRGAEPLARACDLGVAIELTRIARDVGTNARAGRLYLPLDWLEEAGVDPMTFLADPRAASGIGSVVERLLGYANTLYRRAERGLFMLPSDCRPSIRAISLISYDIGAEIARRNFDSVSRCIALSPWRKLLLVCQAMLSRSPEDTNANVSAPPPLPETQFLVEAVAGPPPSVPRPSLPLELGTYT